MRLAMPAIREKKQSVFWMLSLAFALLVIDYYYAELHAESDWQFEIVKDKSELQNLQKKRGGENKTSCQTNKKFAQFLSGQSQNIEQAICTNTTLYYLIRKDYKGYIAYYEDDDSTIILRNLQLPQTLEILIDGSLIVEEYGRQRWIHLFKI